MNPVELKTYKITQTNHQYDSLPISNFGNINLNLSNPDQEIRLSFEELFDRYWHSNNVLIFNHLLTKGKHLTNLRYHDWFDKFANNRAGIDFLRKEWATMIHKLECKYYIHVFLQEKTDFLYIQLKDLEYHYPAIMTGVHQLEAQLEKILIDFIENKYEKICRMISYQNPLDLNLVDHNLVSTLTKEKWIKYNYGFLTEMSIEKIYYNYQVIFDYDRFNETIFLHTNFRKLSLQLPKKDWWDKLFNTWSLTFSPLCYDIGFSESKKYQKSRYYFFERHLKINIKDGYWEKYFWATYGSKPEKIIVVRINGSPIRDYCHKNSIISDNRYLENIKMKLSQEEEIKLTVLCL